MSSRTLAILLSVSACMTVAACEQYESGPSAVEESVAAVSFEAPARSAGQSSVVPETRPAPVAAAEPELYLNGGAMPDRGGAMAERVADGVQINFDGVELREVVKVVLGDILGATYTIDPSLSGQIVLSSSGPLSETQLLSVLETALQMHGAGLARNPDGTYAVMLQDMMRGETAVTPLGGSAPPRVSPGTGVTIVPLRFIGATAAAQFVQPLLTRPDQVRIDETRNLLLFAGSGAERQSVLDTLSEIDVNWMAGRSVGIFPLRMASPDSVIPELEALIQPLSGTALNSETIRFLPMSRLNAVLVIASQPEQVMEVERWIRRLDRGNVVGIQFFVYQLQHVPAKDVAEILNETFSGFEEVAQEGAESGQTILPELTRPMDNVDVPDDFAEVPEIGMVETVTGNTGSNASAGVGPGLLRGVKIVANTLNNTLLIRATPQAYDMIEQTVRRLDLPPAQVLIEATIAEVTLNDTLRYGVQYFLNTGSVKGGFNTTTPTSAGVINPSLLNPLAQLPGFNFVLTPGSSNITIDALSRITDVKVLSSPSIVVQDNSEAVLNVGDEVPITTRSAVSIDDASAPVVNNIEYRDTGVILEVKPRISSKDVVALEVSQEVSRVAEESTSADNLTPTISQRKITSQVNVQSGQTVVLGGLIQDAESRSKEKVPLLGDIPALGELFQSTSNQSVRTELIVFITPRIIRNAEDARDVSEELRSRMRSMRPLPTAPAEPTVSPLGSEPVPEPKPLLPAPSARNDEAVSPAESTGTALAAPATVPAQAGLVLARSGGGSAEGAVPAVSMQRQERLEIVPHAASQAAGEVVLTPMQRPVSGNLFRPGPRPRS
ncbi:MAG: type II secretion system secretin GspD [Geminicoccaceae bacterium]